MTLSLIFGSAFQVEKDYPDGHNYRLYHTDARTFMGDDSWDMAHVCDGKCLASFMERDYGVGTAQPAVTKCTSASGQDHDASYVAFEPQTYTDGRPTDKFFTVDVVPFDPGDDPYILCAVCERELVRNDEKFEAEFGHKIGEHA